MMHVLLRRMREASAGPVLGGVLNLAGGSAVGQLAVLVVAPVLTRLFAPEQLGQFGLLQAFVGFAAVAVCLRLDLAIVSADSEADASGLLAFCLILCVALALLFSMGLGLLISRNVIGFGVLEYWSVPAAFLLLLATGTFAALRFWYVRAQGYRKIASATATQGAGRAALPLMFGVLGAGWEGLVAGELAGRALGIRSLATQAWKELSVGQSPRTGVRYLLRRYRQYWAVVLPSSLLDALALALPVPVIVATYGVEAAGIWVLVNRVAMAPGQLVGSAVADVFHNEAVRRKSADSLASRRWLIAVLRPVVLTGALAYGVAGALAPWIFGVLFGPAWADAGRLMLILVPALVLAVAVGATGRMLVAMDRSHWKLVADILNVAAPLAAFYYASAHRLSFLQAAGVYSVAFCVANLIYLAAIWRSTRPA
jgi:O-antigen/teichoic acid export membrane protein